MTTITLPPLAITPRPSLTGHIHAEVLKLTSLRSIRLAMLLTLFAAGVGAVVQVSGGHDVRSVLVGAVAFSSAVIAVIGALSGSSEYATGTIQSSLMAVPHRRRLLGAKAIAAGVLGAALGAASGVVGILVTQVHFSGTALLGVLGCALYGSATAILGTFFSLVARSSSISVAGILGLSVLLPGLLGGITMGEGRYITDLLPTEAGGILVVAGDFASWSCAFLLLVGWVAAGGLAALARLTTSDA